MRAAPALLTGLLALLTRPGDLRADCTGSLGVQVTNFELPSADEAARQAQQLREELQSYQQQTTTMLQDMMNHVKYLTNIFAFNCKGAPEYTAVLQSDTQYSFTDVGTRLACKSPTTEHGMLTGIHDDNRFTDLDVIKCVHHDSIQLGDETVVNIPKHSAELASCGPNEAMTGFDATDSYMAYPVHVVCRNITAGALLTDLCYDVAVRSEDGQDPVPRLPDRWPAQCSDAPDQISVVTGVIFHQQRWQKLRCCQLRWAVPGLQTVGSFA